MRKVTLPLVKRIAFAGLGSKPLVALKLRAIARSSTVTILNLHRVAPSDGSTYPPLDPILFRGLLRFIKQHFTVTTFAEFQNIQHKKPKLILSFDDGYRDFFDYAMPILDEEGLLCNHNIIPQLIELGQPPLNVLMGDFVGRARDEHLRALSIEGMPQWIPGMDRDAYGLALSAHLKGRTIAEQKAFAGALAPQIAKADYFVPTPMMTMGQIREMAGRHEIGAHSFEHASMAHEDDAYFAQDLVRCRDWLSSWLGKAMTIYAFPNGSCRPEQIHMARGAGIEHVLLVGEKFDQDLHVHNRFTIYGSSPSELRFRATGAGVRP